MHRLTTPHGPRHWTRLLLTVSVPTLVTLSFTPAAAAAPIPGTAAVRVRSDGDASHQTLNRATELGAFFTDGDTVHVSSTPPATASAHGWWFRLSGAGSTAKVTVRLQSLDYFGHWDTVATRWKVVKSGGGRGNRATARRACVGPATSRWRSLVDVDVVGVDDSPETAFSPERSLPCAP